MSNTFSPNGFQATRRLDGAAWDARQTKYLIAAANIHKFYSGDPVILLSTGYIDVVAPGSVPNQGVRGIFVGCELLATSSGSPWSTTYQGSATVDTTAYVIDDPWVVMRVWVGTGSSSAAGGPVTQANVGDNINYSLGTGSTYTGISGAYVDFSQVNYGSASATLPFTILALVTAPPGTNGTDTTTAGNIIEVGFNQQAFRVGTQGV